VTACVYGNESLIAMRRRGVVRYPFRQGSDNTQHIDGNGEIVRIRNFNMSASQDPKMAVVRYGMEMIVIICNWNRKIYVVRFNSQCPQEAKLLQVGHS